MQNSKWWEDAIIYQIYPRSFKDSDNDGIGDLKGITQKLDYIQSLGVNTLWLNPVTSSNQIDNGYDVMDYDTIDPIFGSEVDFNYFVKEAKNRNFKLIYDFPLNHTSINHKWFKEAQKGKDNPYRNYYIWQDSPEGGYYPNNWTAAFGGSAWSKELNGDQYYMHIFKKQMPELNWDHEPLRKKMAEVIKYWVSRGIDGIRLDAFIYLDVDKSFPDQTGNEAAQDVIEYGENLRTYLAEMNTNISKKENNIFLMGEATSADAEKVAHYTDEDVLDRVISLQHFTDKSENKIEELPAANQHVPLDFVKFKKTQKEFQEKLADKGGPILFWNNHDRPRSQQKYGNVEKFRDATSKMMATLLYLQKGTPIIYYGEEVGMNNSEFKDPTNISDNSAMSFYEAAEKYGWSHEKIMGNLNLTTRDASRGIMQWNADDRAGFTEDAAPWTVYKREDIYNVEDQEKNSDSILNYYRDLIALKKTDLFKKGDWKLLDTKETLYVYERTFEDTKAVVFCNFSDNLEYMEIPSDYTSDNNILSTHQVRMDEQKLILPEYSAFVFVTE